MKSVLIRLHDIHFNSEREIVVEALDVEHDGIDFNWTEGNMSCDCNRGSRFYPDSVVRFPCGEVRFELIVVGEIEST